MTAVDPIPGTVLVAFKHARDRAARAGVSPDNAVAAGLADAIRLWDEIRPALAAPPRVHVHFTNPHGEDESIRCDVGGAAVEIKGPPLYVTKVQVSRQ